MELIAKKIDLKSKTDVVFIYPIGDIHIGAMNCAESHFRQFVDFVKNKPNAYWFGGGDYCDCITPQDTCRFDHRSLPDWLFVGNALTVKEALCDIAKQQRERFCEIIEPIKDKCLGLMEGNHEYSLMKYSNNGHHYLVCEHLKARNLTDMCGIRLNFSINGGPKRVIKMWAAHGHGGGRTPGAEPAWLNRFRQMADGDIFLRGHSHIFDIEPTEIRLCMPSSGAMPDECQQREVHSANWGCWVKSYAKGPSTYDSRALYPPRPLKALEIKIKPFHNIMNKAVLGKNATRTIPIITLREWEYE